MNTLLARKTAMNNQFKIKLLQNLARNKPNQGFTLIELLVVVLIIGVLAAIALPNLLGQVAKGRQAEAKNNLGAINRAQQVYRSEKGVFVSLTQQGLGLRIQPQYYIYSDTVPPAGSNSYASYTAVPILQYQSDIKNYASAVSESNAAVFAGVICESVGTIASGNGAVAASTPTADTCTTGNQVN